MTNFVNVRIVVGMRKTLIATLLVALSMAPAARADTFTPTGALPARLAQVERAITYQVATEVSHYWPVTPVTWGPGGIPVTFEPVSQVPGDCGGNKFFVGCHWSVPVAGALVAGPVYVPTATSYLDWQVVLDHEILETEVDPTVTGVEVCDPVEQQTYTTVRYPNVPLSNWVLPRKAGSWTQRMQLRAHLLRWVRSRHHRNGYSF